MAASSYVILTPARNEGKYLGTTIEAVAAQSVRPLRWLILDDGSTDQTAALASESSARTGFITARSLRASECRSFGSKAEALHAGYEDLRHLSFEYLAILDADVTVERDYYERLLQEFEKDATLGLAGGILLERCDRGGFRPLLSSTEWSVSGPIQMFRRRCWEDIGGYLPLPRGGIDAVAEYMARMGGWRVRAFPELHAFHLRQTGSSTSSVWTKNFHEGVKEYGYGVHPLFQILKAVHRAAGPPLVLGSLLRLAGYTYAWISGEHQALPKDVIQFEHQEQWSRIVRAVRQR
jgi:biofilm PGA synthesis N-glycosyltransferase PgaC